MESLNNFPLQLLVLCQTCLFLYFVSIYNFFPISIAFSVLFPSPYINSFQNANSINITWKLSQNKDNFSVCFRHTKAETPETETNILLKRYLPVFLKNALYH
jgi:hypothetical protein